MTARTVTTAHLRARAERAEALAKSDEALRNTLLALARQVVANEFRTLADEADAEGT
jgi:hypothetical protein